MRVVRNICKRTANLFAAFVVLIVLLLSVVSCQDVIEVDVPSEEPRLIVDALIRVDTSEAFTEVVVKVSETRSFFETVPPANLQQITIAGTTNGSSVILNEVEEGSGIYSDIVGNNFLMSERLILQIDFVDEFYVAFAEFVPTVPIDEVVQGDGTLFGDDETEVIVTITDSDERNDFYLFDFDFGNFLVTEDEFFQGQEFQFSYFYDDEVSPGDEVEISIMGVDEAFHNYMDQVIDASEQDFGVFETPSVTIRGNVINATQIDNDSIFDNTTTPDNFALGYFAIVQTFKTNLVIEE